MTRDVFAQLFQDLIGNRVIIELKNDVIMKGILHSSDSFLNLRLVEIEVLNSPLFPQLPRITQAFVRGSSVTCVHLPPEEVDLARVRAMSRA
jgi:U6 snRNA-associated Sm-like protein LSm2